MTPEQVTAFRDAANSDLARRYGIGAAVNLEQFHEVLDALTGAQAEVSVLTDALVASENGTQINAGATEVPGGTPEGTGAGGPPWDVCPNADVCERDSALCECTPDDCRACFPREVSG